MVTVAGQRGSYTRFPFPDTGTVFVAGGWGKVNRLPVLQDGSLVGCTLEPDTADPQIGN